jgi:hypothetical protein
MIRREQDHITSRALAQGDNRGSEGAHRSLFEPSTRLVALRTDPGSTCVLCRLVSSSAAHVVLS